MSQPDRPIGNCYWVREGKLLAGEYPGHWDTIITRLRLRKFLEAGVSYFLDLTQERELNSYVVVLEEEAEKQGGKIIHRRMPIRDLSVPTSDEMVAILDAIDQAISGGHTVYLHCWGGVGRTGTVVGCHLVRNGLSGSEALKQIAIHWQCMEKADRCPRSPETPEQQSFVLEWREQS